MHLNEHGLYQPTPRSGASLDAFAERRCARTCPFAPEAADEDQLAANRFPQAAHQHPSFGCYQMISAGGVNDSAARARAAAGGLASWVLEQLLGRGAVDRVAMVGPGAEPQTREQSHPLFTYRITCDTATVQACARSRYYPVELTGVVSAMRREPGRYAVVGLPCMIKALHLIAREDADINRSLLYTVGLFCGHLKSAAFTDCLAWQLGFQPGTVREADYRVKRPGHPANRYAFRARDGAGRTRQATMAHLLGGNWGMGLFKPRACDYCDDLTAESADIAIGDAWLPAYIGDSRGTSLAIARHRDLEALLHQGIATGELSLDPLPAEAVYASQAAGFRHRHDGLADRLARRDAQGLWRPRRRIGPDADRLDPRQRQLMIAREALAERSHAAFRSACAIGSLRAFHRELSPWIRAYEQASGQRPRRRLWRAITSALRFARLP